MDSPHEWLVQDPKLLVHERKALERVLEKELSPRLPRVLVEGLIFQFCVPCDDFRFLRKTLWLWSLHALLDSQDAHPMLDAVATVLKSYKRSDITRFGVRMREYASPERWCDVFVEFLHPDSDLRLLHHWTWDGDAPVRLTKADWNSGKYSVPAPRDPATRRGPPAHSVVGGRPVLPTSASPSTIPPKLVVHVNDIKVLLATRYVLRVQWVTVSRPALARWLTQGHNVCNRCSSKTKNVPNPVCGGCWDDRLCPCCQHRWCMDEQDLTQAETVLGAATRTYADQFSLPL